MRYAGAMLVLLLLFALQDLGAEFRELRTVRGHFGGGSWVEAVDAWGGRKHQIMGELGEALAKAPESCIREIMGPPDAVSHPGDLSWTLVGPAAGTHLLVYEWRGMHDFLYFTRDGSAALGYGWWMAGE